MATFIKSGYWKRTARGFKGWLNLDELIRSVIGDSSSSVSVQEACEALGIYPSSVITGETLSGDITGELEFTYTGESFTPELTHAPDYLALFIDGVPLAGVQWSYVDGGEGYYDVIITGITEVLNDVKIVVR